MLDLLALHQLVYTRVAGDAAGQAVRTALGADAASRLLGPDARLVKPFPVAPFLVFRPGTLTVESLYRASYAWFVYDTEPSAGRIDLLVPALVSAYTALPRLASPTGGAVNSVAITSVTPPFPDSALGLTGRRIALVVTL